MNSTAKIIIVLTLLTVISGGILAVLDTYTKPRIEAHQNQLKSAAVSEVLPDNVKVETLKKNKLTYYKATQKNKIVAYAFQVSGGGYQSELVVMVGVTPDFSEIIAAKIISQVETPGLGTKIEKDPSNKEHPTWFMDQFKGLKINPAITYVKNAKPSKNTEVQAITGATISSVAIVDILNKQIKAAKAIIGE